MSGQPENNSNGGPGERPLKDNAWMTLATNDTYALGALVLAQSLNVVGTQYKKCIMVTDGVTSSMGALLREVFDRVVIVDLLDSNDGAHLALLERPELGITFTKIHCWLQTEYGKCVFLDADTMVLQNCDELFEREELSAAPDVGWPDCFNSGVFVFRPNVDTFNALTSFALENRSFDGGDQGLLNQFFKNWPLEGADKRLPFVYNMCSNACYSYIPAFKMFGGAAKIIHFIGKRKPWLFEFNPVTGKVYPAEYAHLTEYLQLWWDHFIDAVLPKLNEGMAGLPRMFSILTIDDERSKVAGRFEDHLRRVAWESSTADYLGRDSFDKVWEKISETMSDYSKTHPNVGGPGSPDAASSSTDSVSTEKREAEGRKSPPSEGKGPAEDKPRVEDPKGVPQAAAPTPLVATQSLPSAPTALEPLVDVDSSGASNLGSLEQTVSQAVAPSLSSLELSQPTSDCTLDALTVGQVVPAEPPIALFENVPSAKVALNQALPPSDSILPELSAEVVPIQALPPSDSVLPEPSAEVVPIQALPPSDSVLPEPSAEVVPIQTLPPSDSILPEPSAEPAAEQPALPFSTNISADNVLVDAALVRADISPLVKADPPLEPEPLPMVTRPVPVPRTPTVTEATPPTSPPIGPVGGFPSPSHTPTLAPAGAGVALSKEQVQSEQPSQSDAETAPVPPKRRGGPSKGGKAAIQRGKK